MQEKQTEINTVALTEHLLGSNYFANIIYVQIRFFCSKFQYIYRERGKRKRRREKGKKHNCYSSTNVLSNQVASAVKKKN